MVHAQLLRFIQASDPRILGEGNANLPKIVEVRGRVSRDCGAHGVVPSTPWEAL